MEVRTKSGSTTHMWALMWKTDFVWDPATDGAICTVTLQIDEKAINPVGPEGQNVNLLVVQDGKYYGMPYDPWKTLAGTTSTWETLVMGPDGQSNFFKTTPWPSNPTEQPDFSVSGSPIYFGFMAGVSQTPSSRRMPMTTGG